MDVGLIFRSIRRSIPIVLLILLFTASEVYGQGNMGYLWVISRPEQAMIYLNSEYTNSRTPMSKLLNLEPGEYRLALSKPGYKLYEDKITIEPKRVFQVSVALAEVDSEELSRSTDKRYVEAYISVESNPSGADVYLDGELVGKTPVINQEIEVDEPKDMRLKIVKTNHEPHEEIISWVAIRDRVKIYVSAELKPLEQPIDAVSPVKPQRAKRFTINAQVIAISIVLIVMIAILATRIVIRLRQRAKSD